MKSIFALGIRATAHALVVFSVFGTSAANASIVNGGFETGDLTGWSASPGSLVSVVSGSVAKIGEGGSWSPAEGNYFAYLSVGAGEGVYTLLSQVFVASVSEQLSFDTFFDAGDYLPYNDDGYVNVINTDTSVVYPQYAQSVATVGSNGSHGWANLSFIIPLTGNYRIEAGVRNVGDNGGAGGALGLDNISLTNNGVGAIPEPFSFVVWGGLAIITGLVAVRRHQKSVGP